MTDSSVIDGLNAAWTLAHSKERVPVPPYLLTDAVREIERLRGALEEIERNYGSYMSHVDFRVGAYQAAWNALNPDRVQEAFDSDLCADCGKEKRDLPSKLCPGCQAYKEHQQ